MAEALGAISAVVGIGTFLVQIGRGIKNVRKAINYNRYQASEDLLSLEADLNSLHNVIEALSGFQDDPLVVLAIARCRQAFVEMEPDLNRLTQTLASDQSRKSRLKTIMKPTTLKTEGTVKDLRIKVGLIVQALIPTSTRITQLELIQAEKISLASSVIAEASTPTEPASACSGSVRPSRASDNKVVAQSRRAYVRLVDTCYHKQTTYAHGRFWWLELTSTPGFWHKCGPRCPSRCEWNATLRLALTWLNIPFAVTASFGITSSHGQYTLRPALSIQHVVSNTSPGFLALWLCQIDAIGVEEGKQRIRDLFRADAHFRYHVNPEGKGYLRHLVRHAWHDQDLQFELLDFLVAEIGMDFSAEEPRLLSECSKWIGEGRHLDLLDTVLENGFAPNGIEAPTADQWPEPCNPDWRSKLRTPDPFFLEYFASIVSCEPEFTGVTWLQRHILADTFHTLLDADGDLLSKEKLLSAFNFLGQSPLHFAVRNISTVKKLVELGHDLNVTDRWGTTPLMYAAAMGFEDVVVYLLQKGALAKPNLRETRFHRTFLDFAIARGHWSLIHRALSTIKDIAPQEIHQVFAEHVVYRAMTSDFSTVDFDPDIRRQHIPLVIQQCGDVNFSFGDHQHGIKGNNLLHYVRSIEEAEALLARGFNLFNSPNGVGRLPIYSLTFDPALVRFCVEHGTSIDHVDTNGQTLLHVMLSRLGGFSPEGTGRKDLQSIRCWFELGADPRHSDDCRCPCSPAGCSSSAFFETGFDCTWFTSSGPSADIFWIFEWQSILEDFHGDEAVKEFLLSFIRRIEFDELGMTHVCCHDGSGIPIETLIPWIGTSWPKILDNEDLCDILDEEEEFINILDQTMHNLALKTVNELQRYLLEILKGRYDRHLQQNAEKRAKDLCKTRPKVNSASVEWHVDYKKDTYWQQSPPVDWSAPVDYSISRYLATYLVYIDLETSLLHDPVSQRSQKDAWYSRRMRLVKELTEVFGLSVGNVAVCIDDAIASAAIGMNDNAGKKIKHRFISFVHASESTTDQNLGTGVRA